MKLFVESGWMNVVKGQSEGLLFTTSGQTGSLTDATELKKNKAGANMTLINDMRIN